jgi:hypothetical protein
LQNRQRKLHEELDAEKRALQPEKPVSPVQPVQRSTFESRLQRKSFAMGALRSPIPPSIRADPYSLSSIETRNLSSTIPLSARSLLPRAQDADYPIQIPESSQPYSKSVDLSPVMQPQHAPHPTEFSLPDDQNTVIVPQ